jgi:DNA-binding NarL/FixJ family response regulator
MAPFWHHCNASMAHDGAQDLTHPCDCKQRAGPPPCAIVPLRVLIIDDDPGFRQAARELLRIRGYAVVADAHDGPSAIAAVELLQPDAVLLDIRLGPDDGFDVARAVARTRPGTAVLLTSANDYHGCDDALRLAGARGFVLKSDLLSTDFTDYWP